jgi:TatD DNase family protein
MILIDTHCHLTHERLAARADLVVAEARAAGVALCITAASDVEDSRRAAALASRLEGVYASAGVHPHEAKDAPGDYLEQLEQIAHSAGKKCVAVGEMGLDYHYDFSPRDRQRQVFEEQLDLAARLGLPVIVHCREAAEDTLAILARAAGKLAGVIHSFTGDSVEVRRFLEQGWHIGFAGIITFKNAQANREAARLVPADRVLVETDAPYLSPEPVRKIFPNVPAHIVHTARLLAELRGVALEALAEQTTANARRLFNLGENLNLR